MVEDEASEDDEVIEGAQTKFASPAVGDEAPEDEREKYANEDVDKEVEEETKLVQEDASGLDKNVVIEKEIMKKELTQ